MPVRWSRVLGFVALAVLLVGGVLALAAWFNRHVVVSWANYERIRPGMMVEEVERLMGAPGSEVTVTNGLPQVVDHGVPLGDPKRIKPVVSGERYLKWNLAENDRTVIVSLQGGVVAEKWFRELSL